MNTNVQNRWNVITESIRREYGLPCVTENRMRYSGGFQKSCLGSLFIVKRMHLSHFLKESSNNNLCMNFKENRNLICTGNSNRWIQVYDWEHDKLIYSYKTKHLHGIGNVKFLNTGGNGMDIISAGFSGQIRHACIAPDGNLVSKRIFLNSNQGHKLITVPRSPLEFIAASTNAGIFLIDLRCERWSPAPDAIVFKEEGGFCHLEDIAHHPFAPEICVGGQDHFVRVFDKRNLKETAKKFSPIIANKSEKSVNHCSYNYDGSEILANYSRNEAYLFDNKCCNIGEFIHRYTKCNKYLLPDQIKFFGPKSECLLRGIHGQKIFFQDKSTYELLGSVMERSDLESTITSYVMLEVHPHLPVVASSVNNNKISIWAPTRLNSKTQDDLMNEVY